MLVMSEKKNGTPAESAPNRYALNFSKRKSFFWRFLQKSVTNGKNRIVPNPEAYTSTSPTTLTTIPGIVVVFFPFIEPIWFSTISASLTLCLVSNNLPRFRPGIIHSSSLQFLQILTRHHVQVHLRYLSLEWQTMQPMGWKVLLLQILVECFV